MKLKSFGCSFIYGTDLLSFPDDRRGNEFALSELAWPALISKKLGLTYECHASPGAGNFKIMCEIFREASYQDPAIFVINWTWNDRFDYINDTEQWSTLRPSEDTEVEKFYYQRLHSQIHDMMSSASYIHSAINLLRSKNIPFQMTYMDYTLFEEIDPNWYDPRYLEVLRKEIKPYLELFEGKNFLDWSRDQGFAISDSWHPLEDAHRAAADLMLPKIQRLINP